VLAANTGGVSISRLEGLSDGVLAVAITLLVLFIRVPVPPQSDLGRELGQQWPSYAAYVISFMTIGIIWINHHVMIGRLRAPDQTILILNLVLLMSVALIPFSTSLFATYPKQGQGEHLAAAVYGGALLTMSISFWGLNWTILTRKSHLLARQPRHQAPSTRRQLDQAIAATSSVLKPAASSASSSLGNPATSPSGAGIVVPSKSEPSPTWSTPIRSATYRA
jgi:uncharacterized membrane protein